MKGVRREQEVLSEFLDTFQLHFTQHPNGNHSNGAVILDDFLEYYRYLGANINDDDQFI